MFHKKHCARIFLLIYAHWPLYYQVGTPFFLSELLQFFMTQIQQGAGTFLRDFPY